MTARPRTALVLLLAATIVAVSFQEAFALIRGEEGNSPVRDPGWPAGAAVIFNAESRIAYWVRDGDYHAECRGDARALSAVLADFAKLDVKSKKVVLRNGVGQSFWLNMNNEPDKRPAARMDWRFTVWSLENWEQLRKLPADINPTNANDAENGPPSLIEVYTGGNIKWDDVVVPKGLKIVDQRLEAHGFTLADRVVLQGKVTDLATQKPLAAKVRLERVEPQPKGGYRYPMVAEMVANAQGRWVFKKVEEGWLRVVIEADGYVPRVAGHARFDDQPGWQSYDSGLSRPAPVTGRLMDDAGQPLADVDVRIGDVVTQDGGSYESPLGFSFRTGKDGRFRAAELPIGKATIWVHKPGYTRPGLGQAIITPASDIELKMTKSARVEVTVDFTGKERPEGYIVRMEPEGGSKIGSYGGVGNINDKNQITFDNVPPGRYVFSGRPNPGSSNQETDSVTINLKGGQSAKVTLNAK
ncbi:MAG: carboxypeptidase-like regulatory domain-containing protein [Gemmataceae bacterium]|nr:carboxypeptidase-like regulatory domain-containing protein [Gemmataceae bacterium]MCI0739181.1 carboxypeptidase-like regulatory domain-containing protein [Gemmataceae bacterium]